MPPPTRANSAIDDAPIAKALIVSAKSVNCFGVIPSGAEVEHPVEHDAEPEQAERRDREAHHRAAVEGDLERAGLAVRARRFGGADVALGGRLHPDEAGEHRADAAEHERDAAAGADGERQRDGDQQHHRREHHVLAAQERHRALFDQAGDLPHARRADRLALEVDVHRQRAEQA